MDLKYVFGFSIAILMVGVLALPVSAAGDMTFPALDNQVQVRQAHLAWKAAEQVSGMQAAIGYINSLEGADSTKLTELLGEFTSTASTIDNLDTHAGLNAALRTLVQSGIEFRIEVLRQMVAGEGSWSDLRVAIRDGLEEDKAKISALEIGYWNTRTSLTMENFRTWVDRAQQLLDTLKTTGYDTTQPQATLDAIKAQKGDLQAALDARSTEQIRRVWTEIHGLSKQLATQVKELQVKIPEEKKVQFWINAGERAIERAGQVQDDLDRLGIDTSSLKPILTAAKDDLKAAQDAFAAGDLSGAKKALGEVRLDLLNLTEAYRNLIQKEKLSQKTQNEARSLAGALSIAAVQMKEIA